MLGSEGQTDEQIAESIGENDPLLALISPEDWELLYKQPAGWQGELLDVVGEYGEQGLEHYLSARLGKAVS